MKSSIRLLRRVVVALSAFTLVVNAQTPANPPVVVTPTPAVTASAQPTPSASPATDKIGKGSAAATTKGSFVLPPEKANPVVIPRFEQAPVIDGKLDDEVWQKAVVLKDFYQIQPGDNVPPSKPTEVLLGYDPKFLYIAFKATDEPDKVRATVAKRDNIFQDDYVGFFLDTFNDKRKAFEVFFNPLGIQGDGIITEGRGEDFSVDLLMESKGIVHETGFNVEIAIPFKSLRFEAGKGKLWGAHFFRRIKRFENELDSWMPFSRSIDSNLSQAGHLTGLEGISVERTLELIPSVTVSQNSRFVPAFSPLQRSFDPGRIVNEPATLDLGLTAKFIPSSAVTVDLAINPDFAQVEADQLVVTANQRFPIFFPEKRPFFLEGIDIFQTPITAVHTRAIVDPDLAVKTTGKKGRNTFGLMLASDNGPGNLSADDRGALNACVDLRAVKPETICNSERFLDKNAYIGVLRLKRDVGKENSIGMLATSYNFIEKHNQVLALDGRFRLDKQTTISFQTLGTTSRNFFFDPNDGLTRYRTGNGFGYSASYTMSGRNWGWEVFGEGFTRDYRADVGFFQRTNSNFNFAFLRYNSDPNPKKKIISYHIHTANHIDYDWQGRMYAWESENLVELQLPRNSWVGVWWEPGYERLFDHEFGPTREAKPCNPFAVENKCTFYGESNERSSRKQHLSVFAGSNFSKKIQFNGQVIHRWGHFDFDFGNGDKYPRVSPAALALGQAAPLDPGRGSLLQMNGSITYQPTNELRASFSINSQRLRRYDTDRTAFAINILTTRGTYQFTKSTFARLILDYNTLNSRMRSQALFGWTPSPGTAFYAGYNDDLNYDSRHPFTREIVPGFRRNSRTFFIKMSYLIRRGF
ncbi:MAG TPA: carbohydrate binding family 9 domain-containing protein [Pyrinomonadaceae bacterium]|nr:carbohydrate binding family 9 domain-containing protein [Pyrinomonadaceae bacterium]